MRFGLIVSIVTYILVFGASSASAEALCKDRIIVAVPNMPPYSQLEPDGQTSGLDVQLIKRIAELSGCEIVFKTMPWKRGLLSLKEQQVHMVIMASYKEERKAFGRYTLPYRWETQLISARTSLPKLTKLHSLEDLAHHQIIIGGVRGAFHGPEFDAIYVRGGAKDLKRDITDYGTAITLMRFGRLDGIVSDSGVFRHLAKKNNYRDWVFLDFPVFRNKVHLLLAKSVSDDSLARLNSAIRTLISSPDYARIYPRESLLIPGDNQS